MLGRGVPLYGQLCLSDSAPSPSSQKYSWAETRSPHRLACSRQQALCRLAPSLPDMPWTHPLPPSGQDARDPRATVVNPGNPPGPRAWTCTLPPALHQPHCPTGAASVAQSPVQPSADTLPCQASASGPSPRHPGPISFSLWVCISALGHLGPLSSRHDPPPQPPQPPPRRGGA